MNLFEETRRGNIFSASKGAGAAAVLLAIPHPALAERSLEQTRFSP
jgi:hypothetical protein